MEIRLSKDDKSKVPMSIEMVKHGIFGKKIPSLIINHDAVIPIYVFRPGKLSDLHTEITVGDTMGVINIKGTPVIPGCIDGKVILPFFDIQEILEYDNMTASDIIILDAIVIVMTPNKDKVYPFYLMGAKVKCWPKDFVKIKAHFNLNGFDVDEFHADMCSDDLDIDFPDADTKTTWDENGSTTTTKSFVVDDLVDDDDEEE